MVLRYVVNKNSQRQAVTATSLLVTTEVQPTKLESTTMGIHPTASGKQ